MLVGALVAGLLLALLAAGVRQVAWRQQYERVGAHGDGYEKDPLRLQIPDSQHGSEGDEMSCRQDQDTNDKAGEQQRSRVGEDEGEAEDVHVAVGGRGGDGDGRAEWLGDQAERREAAARPV